MRWSFNSVFKFGAFTMRSRKDGQTLKIGFHSKRIKLATLDLDLSRLSVP